MENEIIAKVKTKGFKKLEKKLKKIDKIVKKLINKSDKLNKLSVKIKINEE